MTKSIQSLAKDFNGAAAGEFEPAPNMNTIDAIAGKTGIEIDGETPLEIAEMMKQRDKDRLNFPDSAEDRPS